jgi:FecR-like protein
MKRARTASIPSLFVFAMLVSLPLTSIGQTPREKFVISAKAGGVNAVTGRATRRSHGTAEWQELSIKEDLEAGDVVRTERDGRVEMLLNPGSYMRIGENSEFELADNSLENLEVRLVRGTAIVEVTGLDGMELLINIITPHTRMAIVRRGLYRVNVFPGDATELIVRKGRVMLDGSHMKVNGGNKVVFSNTTFSVAKLRDADKKNLDNLEVWSKDRAKTVAQANRGFTRRDMSLAMASFDAFDRFSPRYSGMWMFSRAFGCYTFLPFYGGWGSPYGSSYSNGFFGGCCGRSSYGNPGYYNPGVGGYNPGVGGTNSPSPATPNPPTSLPSRGSEPRAYTPEPLNGSNERRAQQQPLPQP